MKTFALLFLAVMSFCSFAQIKPDAEVPSSSCHLMNENLPTLDNDDQSKHPVNFSQVRSIFQEWRNENLEEDSQSSITHFALKNVRHHDASSPYWLYVIRHVVFLNDEANQPSVHHTAITLSGKVLYQGCKI